MIQGKSVVKECFYGKVYLLQNGLTFSADFAFAAKLNYLMERDGGNLKVIGEQNGDDEKNGEGSGGLRVDLALSNS